MKIAKSLAFVVLAVFLAVDCAPFGLDWRCGDVITDLVFLVDASESMNGTEFNMEKDFANDLARLLPDNFRYGAVVFSRSFRVLRLRDFTDVPTFTTALSAMEHLRAGTWTHLALDAMREMMVNEARPGANRICIVITDGRSRYKDLTLAAAAKVRAAGIHAIAVGIGHRLDMDELEGIAGNTSRVFQVDDFNGLAILVNKITNTFCPPDNPTGEPTTRNPDSMCDDCQFDNGVGYVAHPEACHLYYQCQEETMGAHLMQCPYGLFWSQPDLVCRRPDSIVCLNDECRHGNLTTYAMPHSCAGYWICTENRTQAWGCCGDNKAYVKDTGCVASDTCVGGCGSDTSSNVTCNTVPHESNEAKFYIVLADGSKQEMDCAAGTAYEQKNCECSKLLQPPTISPDCKPELYLPFDKDTKDYSGKGVYGSVRGNVEIKTGIPGAVGNGAALFDGRSRIVFWRFANDDFRQTLLIKFRYLEMASTSSRNETLVSNSDCSYHWSVAVNYDRSAQETVGHIRTDTEVVQTTQNTGTWKNVELKYNQGNMTLTVNGVVTRTTTHGDIARSMAALQIGGKCKKNDAFTGYIDEFYLYKCF